MIQNGVRDILDNGGVAYGTFTTLKEPAIVEMLGNAGYDFTIIDMEHAPTDFADVEALSTAAQATGLTPFVRVPRNDANAVMRIVENGIPGVMAPHITTAEEARAIVMKAKYWPVGDRGMDPSSRSAGYGLIPWDEHIEASNRQVMVIVLIEDKEALDNLDEICQVPGIDAGFAGPSDLSRSFGVPGQIDHPDVVAALHKIEGKFLEHGIKVGRAAFDDQAVRAAIDAGASLITSPIIDSIFLSKALADHLTVIRKL